jgi:hypothetical protein
MAARRRLRSSVSREGAVLLYKVLIGLHARTLLTQKTGAKVACKVACKIINIMTGLGMPVSRRIA